MYNINRERNEFNKYSLAKYWFFVSVILLNNKIEITVDKKCKLYFISNWIHFSWKLVEEVFEKIRLLQNKSKFKMINLVVKDKWWIVYEQNINNIVLSPITDNLSIT